MKRVLYDDLRSMPEKYGFKNDRYCDYTSALPSSHSQVTPCQGQRRKRPLSPPLPAQVLFVLTSVEISCLGGVSLQSGRRYLQGREEDSGVRFTEERLQA